MERSPNDSAVASRKVPVTDPRERPPTDDPDDDQHELEPTPRVPREGMAVFDFDPLG